MIVHLQPLGESQPLKVFHRGLLEMLKTLLQNHSEDCLKCIGNILKVCQPRQNKIQIEKKIINK